MVEWAALLLVLQSPRLKSPTGEEWLVLERLDFCSIKIFFEGLTMFPRYLI
jgi:hypothetical protein